LKTGLFCLKKIGLPIEEYIKIELANIIEKVKVNKIIANNLSKIILKIR